MSQIYNNKYMLQEHQQNIINNQQKVKERKKITGSTMMFVNNCVGDVLLTVAFRFGKLGLPTGACMLTFCFAYQVWGFAVIAKACALLNVQSLMDLLEKIYNKKLAMFIDMCAVAMLFGVVICYVIIVSSYLHQALDLVMNNEQCSADDIECLRKFKQTEFYIKLVVGFIILPLEDFITSIKVLDFISMFAALFVLITVVCVVVRFSQTFMNQQLPEDPQYVFRIPLIPMKIEPLNFFSDFTGMYAMFCLQPCIPPLFGEIPGSNKLKERILTKASAASSTILYLIYMIMAVCGCLLFYGDNQPNYQSDNILVNFSSYDMLMSIMRIAYALVIMIGYPVYIFQIRASVASWVRMDQDSKCYKVKFLTIGFVSSLITSSVALVTPSILIIFDPFCATFGAILFQIVPIMIWYKLPYMERIAEPDEHLVLSNQDESKMVFQLAAKILGGIKTNIGLQSMKNRLRRDVSFMKRGSVQLQDEDVLEDSLSENAGENAKLTKIRDNRSSGDNLKQIMDENLDFVMAKVMRSEKVNLSESQLEERYRVPKWRKIVFYSLLAFFIAFNSVSFGVAIAHIFQGGDE